jgi:hypothetical protein
MGIDQFIATYIELCNNKKRGINSRRAFQFEHGWAVQNLTKLEWANLPEILQFGLASIRSNYPQIYKDLTVKELVKVVQIWRGRG